MALTDDRVYATADRAKAMAFVCKQCVAALTTKTSMLWLNAHYVFILLRSSKEQLRCSGNQTRSALIMLH